MIGINSLEEEKAADELVQDILIIGGKENVSLQDSFSKFLEKKKAERRFKKNSATVSERTQEFKAMLRQKFIDRAMSYIGVPYHEKYQPEGSPAYPLYLDCCGLVRQVVTDLREDFGFLIGKWNQAYQCDTLPIVLTESELRPGDLIFYEGLFYSNR